MVDNFQLKVQKIKAVCVFFNCKFGVVVLPVKYFQKLIAIVILIKNIKYVINVSVSLCTFICFTNRPCYVLTLTAFVHYITNNITRSCLCAVKMSLAIFFYI